MASDSAPDPLHLAVPDDGDELARAEVYGLLSQLFLSAPDAALQAQFEVAVTSAPVRGAFLEASWIDLVGAARRLGVGTIDREFRDLFEGVGKADILPFASFFGTGRLNDKALVDVRRALHDLGLEGTGEGAVTEDHVASVCEVMRWLIAGDDAAVCNLTAQRRFFEGHVGPWVPSLCAVIAEHPRADFYAHVAKFTRDFLSVEAQAFDLLDA